MLPNANELVAVLKKAALDAVEASKPVNVYFGKVLSAVPLKINVEQKMILGEKQLVLSRNVTNFTTMVTVDWLTEGSQSAHTHKITGQKKITVHNGLVDGEKVILIRQQEGQKFIVWDRIGK